MCFVTMFGKAQGPAGVLNNLVSTLCQTASLFTHFYTLTQLWFLFFIVCGLMWFATTELKYFFICYSQKANLAIHYLIFIVSNPNYNMKWSKLTIETFVVNIYTPSQILSEIKSEFNCQVNCQFDGNYLLFSSLCMFVSTTTF